MAKKNSKHAKKSNINNQKHYNKSLPKLAFIIVLILIIFLVINLKSNVKNTSYDNIQIILNNENITENLKDTIISKNGKIYMSFDDIQKYIDKTLYFEEETGTIITTSNKKIAAIRKNNENIIINGSTQKIKDATIEENEKIYLAISELEDVYDYKFDYISNTNIVTMDNLNKKCIKAYAKKDIKIKEENKTFSKITEKVPKGNWVIYIGEENGAVKIRTQNGNIGYAKKSYLDNIITERDDLAENQEKAPSEKSLEYDITKKDITNFEKRLNIINLILQEAIKNDNMYVKVIYNGEENLNFQRFKIEIQPILRECGITVDI